MPSVSPAAYFGVNGDTDNLLVSSPLIADISSILIKNQKKKNKKRFECFVFLSQGSRPKRLASIFK